MNAPITHIDDISAQLGNARQRAEILTLLVEQCDRQLRHLIEAGIVTELAISTTGFGNVVFQAYEVKTGICSLEEAVEGLHA